jgi:phosphoglycolate phosphatase-like HAD superfamily hydrolase
MFIIGDTPKDVECAKPFGATSVAVATGLYSTQELAESKPDHLFNDLSDTEGLLDLFR